MFTLSYFMVLLARMCFVEASIASRWIGQKTTKLAFDMYSFRELEHKIDLEGMQKELRE